MSHKSIVSCDCLSHRCRFTPLGYTEIPRSTQQQHRRDDDLDECFSHLSLSSTSVAAESGLDRPTDLSIQTQTNVNPLRHTLTEIAEDRSIVQDSSMVQKVQQTMAVMRQFHSITAEYEERLKSLDIFMEDLQFNESSCTDRRSGTMHIQQHISWITSTMTNVQNTPIHGDEGLEKQRNYVVETFRQKLKEIERWEVQRFNSDMRPEPSDTAQNQASRGAIVVNNEHNFKQSFSSAHPLILLAMFIAVILDALADLADSPSNFLLKMLYTLLKTSIQSYSDSDQLSKEKTFFLKKLPQDIRTVRSHFNLNPKTIVYASCPKCSAIYKPSFDSSHSFPIFRITNCTHKEPGGSECGTELMRRRKVGNQSIRVPIRPYAYRSLHDFIGEMLSRPGLEELLERSPPSVQPKELTDIFDGKAIREFRGVDGAPFFFKSASCTDLRLAWAISVDWFNPLYNKSAGKSISVGVIAMVCLNLPLHVRNERNNMYVAGIIPGPREPSLHQTNHFITPLIEDLLPAWRTGIWFTKTSKYPKGRRVYSVLIPLVADLPASRKVSGTTGHGSTCFCHLCLVKKDKINNLNMSTFERRTDEEHRRLAEEWRDASSIPQRKALAKQNGVRWSVLLELPYWSPRFIVVDTMHNLFLGLIQYHFRVILGIDFEKASSGSSKNISTGQDLSPKKFGKLIKLLKQGTTSSQLKKFSKAELYSFLYILNIPLLQEAKEATQKVSKDDLVLSLLCCELAGNNVTSGNRDPSQVTAHDVSILDEAFPSSFMDSGDNTTTNPMISISTVTSSVVNGQSPKISVRHKYIGAEEIKSIQAAIRSTTRPSWQQGPPSAFGTSQQGKLKADQWRALLEFDLPIALVEQWTGDEEDTSGSDSSAAHFALLDATMNLALAVCWGTSKRTSVQHVAKYTYYMLRYLKGLQSLNPRPKLVPNHHSALHVGDQLLSFGPVGGWWAFPYERLIGALQKSNTNYQIGQMELTMLKSFYSISHLRSLFQKTDLPDAMKESIPYVERFFPIHATGSYGSHTVRESTQTNYTAADGKRNDIQEHLDKDIYDALCNAGEHRTPSQEHTGKVTVFRSYIIQGMKYSSRDERDGIIFYGKGTIRRPGIIRKIFLFDNDVIFAVHPFDTLSPDVLDPFKRWPEFRAGLWSQKPAEKVEIIDPNTANVRHAALRPWRNQEIYVIRELNRSF